MSLASFSVRRPIVADLTMWAVIGAGLIFGITLRREFFPEVRPNQVSIVAPYPGASPDEIERSLARKIEDRIDDIEGIEEINTTVSEGLCTIRIEFEEGVPIDRAVADVKREVDALQDLPEEAERIIVQKFEPNLPAISLALSGNADEQVMKRAIREIRDDLMRLPGMGDVIVNGVREDQITVEARPQDLLAHNLSLPMLAQRIREAMLDLPSGSIRSSTSNVTLRAVPTEERVDEIRNIIVRSDPSGQVIRLSDVADVIPEFIDTDLRLRLNGKPAVSLTVFKVGEKDAVEMAELVKTYAAARRAEPFVPTLRERIAMNLRRPGDTSPVSPRHEAWLLGYAATAPPPGDLTVTTDLARFIVGRLDLLSRNAFWGGVLVFLTLVLLLNVRVAFWVTVGVVIALLGTLAVMAFVGQTLNLLTMFGLIIVIGILVDDGIVIAENITAIHERGVSPRESAVLGTNQVMWPVIGAVLTTVVAFLPLSILEGHIGDLMSVLPIVVICALMLSLLEALFVLPAHMAQSLRTLDRKHVAGRAGFLQRLEFRMDAARERFFRDLLVPRYERILRVALNHRYLTMIACIGVTIISLGMVAGGRVPFVFLQSSDSEIVNIALRMPTGTPIDQTDEIVRRIEAIAIEEPEVSAVFTVVGATNSMDGENSTQSPHIAQLILELLPVEQRERSSSQIILDIRARLGEVPGVKSLRMEELSGGPEGPDISLTVVGDSPALITQMIEALRAALADYDGVFDIADDADIGQRELRVELLESGSALGFTTESLARQLRGAVYGLEAHTFAGEQEDVDVRVTLPRDVRRSIAAIESLYILSPSGRNVPLREVARLTEADGYSTIHRFNRQRAVTVSADVDENLANTEEIMADMQPRIREMERSLPGVRVIERGRQKDVAESFATLPIGFITAIGLNFVILAWLFGSYLQPLIILTAAPFAVVGVVCGHLLLGYDMTFLSLIGFIALTGVVVNDSIVFVDFYNEAHRSGMPIYNALIEAGRARLRAILLTTITTVLGLLPLISEQSFQARFLIPMAITISFGLMSATVIILVAAPCLILIGHDIRRVLQRFWRLGLDPWTLRPPPPPLQP